MENKGKVLLSTSLGYQVRLLDGTTLIAPRRKSVEFKNTGIIIGDMVKIDDKGQICEIEERQNILLRPRVTNLDMAGVIVSAVCPDFSSFLLDKYMSACLQGNVPSFIIISKWDIASNEEKERIEERISYYKNIGYSVFFTSKDDPSEDEKLKEKIRGKVSIFMGQTGVGKSSLINRLDSSFARAVGEQVSLGRGMHKTKEVAFLPFLGGFLGDTPGFSDFQLMLTKEELSMDFPGFFDYSQECKFKGCLHNGIKGCAVMKAVEEDKLSKESYENYLKLLNEAASGSTKEKKSSHEEQRRKK